MASVSHLRAIHFHWVTGWSKASCRWIPRKLIAARWIELHTVQASTVTVGLYSICIHLAAYCRELATEYEQKKQDVMKKQSSFDKSRPMCPICGEVEIVDMMVLPPGAITPTTQNICVHCETTVCQDCGSYELNPKTKVRYIWSKIYIMPWSNICYTCRYSLRASELSLVGPKPRQWQACIQVHVYLNLCFKI